MNSSKIIIEVVAGVIINEPILQYSKEFIVTSEDLNDETGENVMKIYGFAQEYMRTLWNTAHLNWVHCSWIYL